MAWKRIEDSELTSIADEIRTMAGTANAMKLVEMKSKLVDTNSMIGEQASLIEQIQNVVDNLPDAEGGEVILPEFATVTFRLEDINLSDAYSGPFGADDVRIYASYINEAYNNIESHLLFHNNMSDSVMDKANIAIMVPKNSTILLDFTSAYKHYISTLNSNTHNDFYNIEKYKADISGLPTAKGGTFRSSSGERYANVSIFDDTEIIIKEQE